MPENPELGQSATSATEPKPGFLIEMRPSYFVGQGPNNITVDWSGLGNSSLKCFACPNNAKIYQIQTRKFDHSHTSPIKSPGENNNKFFREKNDYFRASGTGNSFHFGAQPHPSCRAGLGGGLPKSKPVTHFETQPDTPSPRRSHSSNS